MGRQIHFHMRGRDCDAFFAAAKQLAPFVVVVRDSATPAVEPLEQPCAIQAALVLWNVEIAPSVVRRYVPANSRRDPYHAFPSDAPALEFFPTGEMADWDGRPAVTAGRLYAAQYQDNRALAGWYEQLARWLRRHFHSHRVGSSTFRVGPDAWEWHRRGGLLLPMVRPLVTHAWRRLLGVSEAQSRDVGPGA